MCPLSRTAFQPAATYPPSSPLGPKIYATAFSSTFSISLSLVHGNNGEGRHCHVLVNIYIYISVLVTVSTTWSFFLYTSVSGCTAPPILKLSTRWRSVVNFTFRLIYPREEGLGGPQSRSWPKRPTAMLQTGSFSQHAVVLAVVWCYIVAAWVEGTVTLCRSVPSSGLAKHEGCFILEGKAVLGLPDI
jgi:hypothetical protein